MQILIRVKDRPAPYGQSHSITGRGDVIQTADDSHVWSERELTNPAWRIVKAALVQVEADALAANEVDAAGLKLKTHKRQRKINLDHPAIPQAIKDFIADDSRAVQILDMPPGSRGLLNAITVHKGPADG